MRYKKYLFNHSKLRFVFVIRIIAINHGDEETRFFFGFHNKWLAAATPTRTSRHWCPPSLLHGGILSCCESRRVGIFEVRRPGTGPQDVCRIDFGTEGGIQCRQVEFLSRLSAPWSQRYTGETRRSRRPGPRIGIHKGHPSSKCCEPTRCADELWNQPVARSHVASPLSTDDGRVRSTT